MTETPTATFTPTITPSLTPSPIPTLSSNLLQLPFSKIYVDNVNRIKFQRAFGFPGPETILSPDGKHLVNVSYRLILYDFKTFKEIPLANDISITPSVFDIGAGISSCSFSPDGKFLAASFQSFDDGGFRIWSTADGSLDYSSPHWYYSLKFSPDGSYIVLGDTSGIIYLFDTIKHEIIKDWQAHSWVINDFSFSPDGKELASVSSDNTFKVWDFPGGNLLFSATGEKTDEPLDAGIDTVSYSPDGSLIATGSLFGFVDIWKVSDNPYSVKQIDVWMPDGKDGEALSVTFNNDDSLLMINTNVGVEFWKMPEGSLLRTLRQIYCNLSSDETLLLCGNSFFGVH